MSGKEIHLYTPMSPVILQYLWQHMQDQMTDLVQHSCKTAARMRLRCNASEISQRLETEDNSRTLLPIAAQALSILKGHHLRFGQKSAETDATDVIEQSNITLK